MNPPSPSAPADAVEPPRPPALTAVYAPDASGTVLLYAGPLLVTVDDGGTEELVDGAITLDLHPRTRLSAHIPMDDWWSFAGRSHDPDVRLPPGAMLGPPSDDDLSPLDGLEQVHINHIEGGSAPKADRVLFHINGPLRGHMASHETAEG